MEGPCEYGQDTESLKFALGSVPLISFIHTLCVEAFKLLLECAPALHSLLAKASHF